MVIISTKWAELFSAHFLIVLKMKKIKLFLVLFTCLPLSTIAQNSKNFLQGVVFLDKNENGIWDDSEKTVANFPVSNGVEIVKTDRKGRYRISVNSKRIFFPILLNGYSFVKGKPWWYTFQDVDNSFDVQEWDVKQINFGLKKIPVKKKFKVLAIGDIQVDSEQELSFAGRTVLTELMARKDYDFSLFLGDLVNDQPSLFSPLDKMISQLPQPAWFIYGNHDKNPQKPKLSRSQDFIQQFGPRTYAFFKNNILFISLNSIAPSGKYGYKGVYSPSDLLFVENLLIKVKGKKMVVVSQHIPMLMMENKEKLFEILKNQKKVLVLAGHIHTNFQSFYKTEHGTSIHQLTAGAVAGTWWRGERNWEGNPLAMMQDGSPRGYFEIDFANNTYSFKYKAVGLDSRKQMSIWFGENNEIIDQSVDDENRQVLVNVFAGSQKTKVGMSIDGGENIVMSKIKILDPFVNRIKKLQRVHRYPNKTSQRAPYISMSSSHIWEANVPQSVPKGLHKLEIVAKDDYGLNTKETVWFWVK